MSDPICKMCGDPFAIECGYEKTSHGYCSPCASIKLDEIYAAELPSEERYLRPVVEVGGWINACAALGCVKAPLVRAYAAELLRAADEAEKIAG